MRYVYRATPTTCGAVRLSPKGPLAVLEGRWFPKRCLNPILVG